MFLSEQLESVLLQTVLPNEVVICDDGSTDGTLEIVERFVERAPFPVRVVRNPVNLKSTANFAQAISLCTGEFIVLADQDDRWKPHKLERLRQEFQRQPDLQMVFTDADLIDATGQPIGRRLWHCVGFTCGPQRDVAGGKLLQVLLKRYVVTGATMMFRSRLRETVLPIPTCWVHDAWITLLTAAIGGRVSLISEPLIDYRLHAGQQIGAPERTVWQKFQHARKICGPTELERLAVKYQAAFERVASTLGESHAHTRSLAEKVAHLRSRIKMGAGFMTRIRIGTREFLLNRYGRYALGWKSFLVDLLR